MSGEGSTTRTGIDLNTTIAESGEIMAKVVKAYSYCRFSSSDQLGNSSIRRQIERAEQFAKSQGLVLVPLKPDRAMSGYHGIHLKKGSLGVFLRMLEEERIEPGWLLVESLDRISRQEPLIAQTIFTEIIMSGMTVWTAIDNQIYTRQKIKENPSLLFVSLGSMIRAHEESKVKADRSEKYNSFRLQEAMKGKPQRGRCPSWLKYVPTSSDNGKYELIPEMVETVKMIVKLTLKGFGSVQIAKELNRLKRPLMRTANRNRVWRFTTVRYIQQSKTLIGYYEPKTKAEGEATYKPTGKVIKDYYPAIVSENDFYKMQLIVNKRTTHHRHRDREKVSNIFGNVLVDGFDGSPMRLNQVNKAKRAIMKSELLRAGIGEGHGFNYESFETAFLEWITEVQLSDSKPVSNLEGLQGKLSSLDERIKKLKEKLRTEDNDILMEVAVELGAERRDLLKRIEEEKGKESTGVISTKEVLSTAKRLKKAKPEDLNTVRTEIKGAIQSLCNKIEVYIFRKTMRLACFGVVYFADGSQKIFMVGTERGQEDFWIGISLNRKLKANMPDLVKALDKPFDVENRKSLLEFMTAMAKDQLNRPKNDLSEWEWKGIIES